MKLRPCPFCGSEDAPRPQDYGVVVCDRWKRGCGARGSLNGDWNARPVRDHKKPSLLLEKGVCPKGHKITSTSDLYHNSGGRGRSKAWRCRRCSINYAVNWARRKRAERKAVTT